MPNDQEVERLARLRESQLAARKPRRLKRSDVILSKVKPHKPFLVEWFNVLAGRWKGGLAGLICGIVVAVVIDRSVPPQYAWLSVPLLVCAVIIGLVVGKTSDQTD